MATTQTSTGKKSASRTTPATGTKKTLTKKATASSTRKPAGKKITQPASPKKKPAKATPSRQQTNAKRVEKAVAKILVSPEQRYQMIAAEAYLLAESRGFVSGHALDDWIAAEAKIDAMINA